MSSIFHSLGRFDKELNSVGLQWLMFRCHAFGSFSIDMKAHVFWQARRPRHRPSSSVFLRRHRFDSALDASDCFSCPVSKLQRPLALPGAKSERVPEAETICFAQISVSYGKKKKTQLHQSLTFYGCHFFVVVLSSAGSFDAVRSSFQWKCWKVIKMSNVITYFGYITVDSNERMTSLFLPALCHTYGSWITQNIYNKEKKKFNCTDIHRFKTTIYIQFAI